MNEENLRKIRELRDAIAQHPMASGSVLWHLDKAADHLEEELMPLTVPDGILI